MACIPLFPPSWQNLNEPGSDNEETPSMSASVTMKIEIYQNHGAAVWIFLFNLSPLY
jgi:hypothetical protein